MVKRLLILALITASIFTAGFALAAGENVVKISSDIEVGKDKVADEVVAIGGNVTVAGKVLNNVVAIGGTVTLKEGSSVGGEVVVVGGDLVKSPDANVGGKITQVQMPSFIPSVTSLLKGGWMALWATLSILVLLGFLGLAVLLAALIPEHMGAVVKALDQSFAVMLLWGILWAILIVPIAVLLAISIVGIVLIPLEVLLVVLALIIGYISAAIFIGKNILAKYKKTAIPFVDAIIGILVLFLVGFIPIVGPVVKVLFLTAGFGAVLITRFGTCK